MIYHRFSYSVILSRLVLSGTTFFTLVLSNSVLKVLCMIMNYTILVLHVPVYWMTLLKYCMVLNLLDLFSEGKKVVLLQLIRWHRCSYRLFIVKIILFWRYSWLLKFWIAKTHCNLQINFSGEVLCDAFSESQFVFQG